MVNPGVSEIIRRLKRSVPLTTVLYVARYIVATNFGINMPLWLIFCTLFVSFPLYFFASVLARRAYRRWEAAAMGAVLAPKWKGERIGNLDLMNEVRSGDPHDLMLMGPHKRLGPVMRTSFLWDEFIATTQPEHIKSILATEFNNFEKGRLFFEQAESVLGTGVFSSDGDMWKFHRSMTRPFFGRDRISHFDIFDRHTKLVILAIKKRQREGQPLDFKDLMYRFTLDSAGEFLFGSSLNSLADQLPNAQDSNYLQGKIQSSADKFAHAFMESLHVVLDRTRLGSNWALNEIFVNRTDKSMKVVNGYLDAILEEALKRHGIEWRDDDRTAPSKGAEKDHEDLEDSETLLDHLIKITLNKTVLKDEILNLLIAGRDTTAATLAFAMYFLSTRPEVYDKLRTEVIATVGRYRRPTYDDIKTMKYLRAVINETMRLFPVVPRNRRRSIKATTLTPITPGGKPIYVPANTNVMYSVFLMHRRTDLWGPDAREFSPERFLDERLHKYLTPNPFIFLPFNPGPRICLGQQFAYNESSFMLIRLLQEFDRVEMVSVPTEESIPSPRARRSGEKLDERVQQERIWPELHLTMSIEGGLWVNFREG